MKTYTHTFTIHFSVDGCEHDDWKESMNDYGDRERILAAMKRRMNYTSADQFFQIISDCETHTFYGDAHPHCGEVN